MWWHIGGAGEALGGRQVSWGWRRTIRAPGREGISKIAREKGLKDCLLRATAAAAGGLHRRCVRMEWGHTLAIILPIAPTTMRAPTTRLAIRLLVKHISLFCSHCADAGALAPVPGA